MLIDEGKTVIDPRMQLDDMTPAEHVELLHDAIKKWKKERVKLEIAEIANGRLKNNKTILEAIGVDMENVTTALLDLYSELREWDAVVAKEQTPLPITKAS